LISGATRCIAIIDLVLLMVSGISKAMITTVDRTMARP
jgi:hypothetical protein